MRILKIISILCLLMLATALLKEKPCYSCSLAPPPEEKAVLIFESLNFVSENPEFSTDQERVKKNIVVNSLETGNCMAWARYLNKGQIIFYCNSQMESTIFFRETE